MTPRIEAARHRLAKAERGSPQRITAESFANRRDVMKRRLKADVAAIKRAERQNRNRQEGTSR